MAHKLPDGLIQSGIPYVPGTEDTNRIPMDDIIRLWRAHFVIKYAQASDTGTRLEHLFWRIMGSPRLQQALTESEIARFHATISQNIPIRTTPRQSPIRFSTNSDISDSGSVGPAFLSDGRLSGSTGGRNLNISTARTRDRSTSRPRPILRTPGIDTIAPGKSARILTPTWGGDAKGKLPLNEEIYNVRGSSMKPQPLTSSMSEYIASASNTSNSGTAQAGASPKSLLAGSPSKSNRKGSFAVGSKRRRPAMPYRRSSQSTASMNTRSPKQSPVVSQGSFETTQPASDRRSSLQQIDESVSRSEIADTGAAIPGLRMGASHNRSEGDLKLAATNFPMAFNPHMRAMSTKAALSTGVSIVSPATASLQPFGDQGPSMGGPLQVISGSQHSNTRSSQSGIETLQRSRDNLNLLLERDRRRTIGPKKGKKP